MITYNDFKIKLEIELSNAKSIWIATAMISKTGWEFIQKIIPPQIEQNFLIGIDLATEPKIFEELLENSEINARVYQTKYTFHPKVYIIKKNDSSFTAFVGSSNTTNWGLEKNVEMNFQITDQNECLKLLKWFYELYDNAHILTKTFIDDYKLKFNKISKKAKKILIEKNELNQELSKNKGQFFSRNNHKIFEPEYHYTQTDELKLLRKEVYDKLRRIHKIIYPQFEKYGFNDLHSHHNSSQVVSRYYFNRFSGNFVTAMWLHYGKSSKQLVRYKTNDKSVNRPDSFINNVRIQVIIHSKDVGVWLVLGKDNGSKNDRKHFQEQMKNPKIRNTFYQEIKKLGNKYWINIHGIPPIEDLKSPEELYTYIQKESIAHYFIIGCSIDWLDQKLSSKTISDTILLEFKKLYPLYQIMKH